MQHNSVEGNVAIHSVAIHLGFILALDVHASLDFIPGLVWPKMYDQIKKTNWIVTHVEPMYAIELSKFSEFFFFQSIRTIKHFMTCCEK